MRLDQIRSQVDSIRRKLGGGPKQIDQGQLMVYAETGELPSDEMTLAYAKLSECASRCMDLSVSGTDIERDQARQEYDQCLRRWNGVTK